MGNRRKLEDKEYTAVWRKFGESFNFKPSTTRFPGISTTLPQLKLRLKREAYTDDAEADRFYELANTLFVKTTTEGERLYGLDWHHECYDFDPRQSAEGSPVPIYPDGDYAIVLTKDFKQVWFGHPWEETITIIGDRFVPEASKLLSEFEKVGVNKYSK